MTLWAVVLGACVLRASAGDFVRSGSFESVDAFVAAAKMFHPAEAKNDLSKLFTVPELGQREDPRTGTPVVANALESAAALWSDDQHALVFATASPPTEATRSAVGAVFLLENAGESWHIADVRQFVAAGKYAAVSAQLTSESGTGLPLGRDHLRPIITIQECQGGGGYSYKISASYVANASKLERLDLE